MNKKQHGINVLICIALFVFSGIHTTLAAPADDFVTVWQTNIVDSNDTTITLPMVGGPYTVDWENDGSFDPTPYTNTATHDYGSVGTYTVRVRGTYDGISFPFNGDNLKIISVQQWGTNVWTTMDHAFAGAENLQGQASDTPNFSMVESMAYMYSGATKANPNTTSWNTSAVTNMNNMFDRATSADPNTSNWNTSAVTDMASMFSGATSASPNTASWNTAEVKDMSNLFHQVTSDPNVTNWNTAKVENMFAMFAFTTAANPNVTIWNTSKVTTMRSMFLGATTANPNVVGWNTGAVKNMDSMFQQATSFDRDIGGWDVRVLESARDMFRNVTLSQINYDSLLVGWNAQNLLPNVWFSGGNSTYCSSPKAAVAARKNMVETDGWNITDGGTCPSEIFMDDFETIP